MARLIYIVQGDEKHWITRIWSPKEGQSRRSLLACTEASCIAGHGFCKKTFVTTMIHWALLSITLLIGQGDKFAHQASSQPCFWGIGPT